MYYNLILTHFNPNFNRWATFLIIIHVGNLRQRGTEHWRRSKGPNVSERLQMVMAISRPTTAQMVLDREALYLPDDHPLLRQIQSSVAIQGRVLANSDRPVLTCLELTIHMADEEANTLVSSLMSDRADSPILEGVSSLMVLLGA